MTELPATKDWIVRGCRSGKISDNPHGGQQLQAYYVDFDGLDEGVYWRRHAGNEPKAGDIIYGTVSEGEYGPRFKLEQKPEGHVSPSGSADYGSNGGTGKREWKPESQFDPEKVTRISRAHAQHMALLAVAIEKPTAKLRTAVKGWTDFFMADVEEAAMKLGSNGGTPAAPTPDPVSAVKDEFGATALGDDSDVPF